MSMESEKPLNPVPPASVSLPRSKEEAEELAAKTTAEERAKVIAKLERRNKDIENAAVVASIYKHPGWQIIINDILEIERGIREVDIAEMRGNIFDKGSLIDNLQGGLGVIETLKNQLNRYADLANEQPADIEAMRSIMDNHL